MLPDYCKTETNGNRATSGGKIGGPVGARQEIAPILELENVSHAYANGTRALDGVTLSVPHGMFGLLGPNGAGKSTLMRNVATLQTPGAGAIRFGGIDVIAEPDRLRRTLGYLPQDFGVYPRVSAWEMLDHLAALKGNASSADRKATVETLLHQVNLWPVRKKALTSFSGGMRQRLGIAKALIGNPGLIIVDEPTAGLDPEERNRFLNLLAEPFAALAFGLQLEEDVRVFKNSAYEVVSKYRIISTLFMFATTVFVSNIVLRDDDSGFAPILCSTGVGKFDYLIGRFAGAMAVVATCLALVSPAFWIGSLVAGADATFVGPNRASDHLYAYFLIALPNVLITGSIFFALATVTRSMMATYVGLFIFSAPIFR